MQMGHSASQMAAIVHRVLALQYRRHHIAHPHQPRRVHRLQQLLELMKPCAGVALQRGQRFQQKDIVWICTSLSLLLIAPGKFIGAEYLCIFGIYPILKAYIERLARVLWIPLKAIFFTVVVVGAMLVCELLLGVPFFEVDATWVKVGMTALIAVAAIAYDMFLTVMIRFYIFKIRPRIKNLLK